MVYLLSSRFATIVKYGKRQISASLNPRTPSYGLILLPHLLAMSITIVSEKNHISEFLSLHIGNQDAKMPSFFHSEPKLQKEKGIFLSNIFNGLFPALFPTILIEFRGS